MTGLILSSAVVLAGLVVVAVRTARECAAAKDLAPREWTR